MTRKSYNVDTLFKALADPTRLRLISLIGDSEVCVCFFVAILKTSQPKISRHLAYLRRAGIVAARREGKWMHYRLTEPPDEHAARIFGEVRASLAAHPEFQRDRESSKRSVARRSFRCSCAARRNRLIWLPETDAKAPENLLDGLFGLCYGIATACLLIRAVRRNRLSRCSSGVA